MATREWIGRRKEGIAAVTLGLILTGCASGREFWTYVVEPPVEKPTTREQGTAIGQPASPQVITVNYSDGKNATEVRVPVVSSGQQVIIDQKGRPAGEAVNLATLAPTDADRDLDESYVKSGKSVSVKAAPVSIVRTRAMVKKLVKAGNQSLALEYLEQLLRRYPEHVESLRARGSVLLKMGEREAALETYRRAEEIEPNAAVRAQIQTLEKTLGGR